jgi:hypothetical protein
MLISPMTATLMINAVDAQVLRHSFHAHKHITEIWLIEQQAEVKVRR